MSVLVHRAMTGESSHSCLINHTCHWYLDHLKQYSKVSVSGRPGQVEGEQSLQPTERRVTAAIVCLRKGKLSQEASFYMSDVTNIYLSVVKGEPR